MERVVIVGYEPLPGKQSELTKLIKTHWGRLDALGLVSSRQPVILKAINGTLVEIFGWKSAESINEAHALPEVQRMWEEFAAVCTYVPAGTLDEMNSLFSEFTPVGLSTD